MGRNKAGTIMAGAGLLLDVPLHHDEEERFTIGYRQEEIKAKHIRTLIKIHRSVGAHSAPEDKRSRTPMVSSVCGWTFVARRCLLYQSCG